MMPLYDCFKEPIEKPKIYFKKKLKWYEKVWYFITGKKNEYKELNSFKELK